MLTAGPSNFTIQPNLVHASAHSFVWGTDQWARDTVALPTELPRLPRNHLRDLRPALQDLRGDRIPSRKSSSPTPFNGPLSSRRRQQTQSKPPFLEPVGRRNHRYLASRVRRGMRLFQQPWPALTT